MKRRTTIALLFALLMAAGIGSQQLTWGQDAGGQPKKDWFSGDDSAKRQEDEARRAAEDAKRQAENARRQTENIKRQAKELARQQNVFMRQNPGGLEAQIQKAAAELRDAEGDEAKTNAGNNLRSVLDKYFEDDMKNRQEAVGDLEQRLQKLKAQLDRRREKKPEIIDLQMKIAKNEAEGLGFYSEPGVGPFIFKFATDIDSDMSIANPSPNALIKMRVPGPPQPPLVPVDPVGAPVKVSP